MKVYEYCIVLDKGDDTAELLVPATTVLAKDENNVRVQATQKIPGGTDLTMVVIKVRPFS